MKIETEQKFIQRPKVPLPIFKEFMKLEPHKSIALLVAIYVAVFVLAILGGSWSAWKLAPLSVLIIAALQNHLLILLHEGSHGLIHANSFLNDLITDFFCGIPLLSPMKNYQYFHLEHHKKSGEPGGDPEIQLYRGQKYFYGRASWTRVLWMFFKDLCGYNLGLFLYYFNKPMLELQKQGKFKFLTPREVVLNLVIWGSVLSLSIHFSVLIYVVVFWLLPYATVTFFLLKLHGYGEHTGLEGPTEFERTWIHDFNPITDFFIYPIRSGYHLEHHLYPTIPWYKIKAFRNFLLQNPYYTWCTQKVTVDGYFFGQRTIFKTMILGKGFYTAEVGFQKDVSQRQIDIKSLVN